MSQGSADSGNYPRFGSTNDNDGVQSARNDNLGGMVKGMSTSWKPVCG
jgi:hypothetical protein